MKNVVKIVGIIAFLAIIGLAMGCEADPEEQTQITITDIPAGFDGYYAAVAVLGSQDTTDVIGTSTSAVKIKTGVAAGMPMFDKEGKKAVKVKEGWVYLFINTTEKLDGTTLYAGVTNAKVTLGAGEVSIAASKLVPNIEDAAADLGLGDIPDASFFGTYTSKYGASDITETIVFTKNSFKISDDSKNASGTLNGDFLDFTIQEWDESVSTPTGFATDYPKALLFKGIITDAKPKGTDLLYGNQTGPGLSTTDITNKTLVKMYLYYNDSGAKVKFVRTTFVKDTATTVPGVVMTESGGSTARVFTQQ